MKNTLSDLNNYLFEQIERLNDDSLTGEELEIQMARSKAIGDMSEKVIDNVKLQLEATKLVCEYGRSEDATANLPKMIGNGKEN